MNHVQNRSHSSANQESPLGYLPVYCRVQPYQIAIVPACAGIRHYRISPKAAGVDICYLIPAAVRKERITGTDRNLSIVRTQLIQCRNCEGIPYMEAADAQRHAQIRAGS